MISRLLLVGILSILASPALADVQGTGAGGTIPDTGTPLISDINITDDSYMRDVTFCLEDLQHTWVGDLVANITHVDTGRTIPLFVRVGLDSGTGVGDSSDLSGTYIFKDTGRSFWSEAANGSTDYVMAQDTYQASDEAGDEVIMNEIFRGRVTGTWRLSITDLDGTQIGSFANWSLNFATSPVPEPGLIGVLGIALAGMVSRRRR